MQIPPQTTLHFIGIGGIGMSGIAEVLHNLGYQVKGSDISSNQNTSRLENLDIPITIGHKIENVEGAEVVVVSTAVKQDNPELQAAKALRIPVIHRSEMLAEIMRLKFSIAVAGTHGKTTTTSLIASILDTAGLDPTVINGGIINAYNTNARLGTGEWTVVEADESDGSFVRLPATIAVITNIDPEHMEYYKTFDNLKDYFTNFLKNLPFYGLGILCIDHPVVRKLAFSNNDRRIITYGFSEDADIRAVNLRYNQDGIVFDVEINPSIHKSRLKLVDNGHNIAVLPFRLKDIALPMMGKHNVQNALSAIVVAKELGLADHILRQAFNNFKGVKRRFTIVGFSNGIRIVDDYAHHPVEIRAVIQAAKLSTNGRLISVLQPHRYSRLHNLFEEFTDCFDGSDVVILAPVYSAGEEPISDINSHQLAQAIRAKGFSVYEVGDARELACKIADLAQQNDTVLCMGAGSITNWTATLPLELDKKCQAIAINSNL